MKKVLLISTAVLALTVPQNRTYAQGSWTQKSDYGGGVRGNAIGFSIGSKGYIATGDSAVLGKPTNDFWEWDQNTNIWTQKANFSGGLRSGAFGFSIGTKGYIGTGTDSAGIDKNDFWEWDQSTNIWTQKANVGGAPRWHAACFVIGTNGYVGTGGNSYQSIVYNDFWQWNQSTSAWTQKANFGGLARYGAVGFSIGTNGYFGAGGKLSNPQWYLYNDFWEYNSLTNVWTQKANFGGSPRLSATGFSIGTKGYIGTGWDGTNENDFWEYDASLNTWTQKANFGGYQRMGAVGFSINNKGYIGTGTYWLAKDLWEYDPNGNGINEIQNKISISIFPNPFSVQTTLQTDNSLHNATLTVDNYLGQTVKQIKNISGQTVTLFRDNLPSGLYFLRLTQDNKVIATDKLVITDK